MDKEQIICNQTQLVEDGVNIVIPVSDYNIEKDKRYLVPFTKNDKYGFINHNYEIVIPPIYDRVLDSCYSPSDLIRVGKLDSYGYERKNREPQTYISCKSGVINAQGEIVIPLEYSCIEIGENTISFRQSYGHNHSGKYSLVDKMGNTIIPFGQYDRFDPDVDGLVRCRKFVNKYMIADDGQEKLCQDTHHGIVDIEGNVILKCNERYVSPFYGQYKKNYKYVLERIKLENPEAYRKLMKPYDDFESDSNLDYEYGSHYGEYAGTYAQDVAGFSDDVINDAFDGEPDAYWNID